MTSPAPILPSPHASPPPPVAPVPQPAPIRPPLPQGGGNALLAREVRASLRNVRAFALLAIYVAVLGAVVVSQFPSETNVTLQGGGQKGRELFTLFTWAQALLVVIMLPSLAVGALAQERERQTLQPLLMTPLTPLQIVWGKAGGALALAFILLLATLPLTSLCFLLGGISPGELVAAYAALLGLALFCIGVGVYCAAHWRNTTQATLLCYLILPPAIGVMLMFAAPGVVLAGVLLLTWGVWGLSLLWRRWQEGRLGRALRWIWWPLFWVVAALLVCGVLWLMIASRNFGMSALGVVLVVPYMAFAAQIALQQAARDIAANPDPDAPLRERVRDFKDEWQSALAPPPPSAYVPTATGTYSYTPQAPAPRRAPPKPTYGIEPFLPDSVNPVFAREMRAGLAGKAEYFFRFGYVATIGTELLLLGWMMLQIGGDDFTSDAKVGALFSSWARLHLALLMLAAAWLGARAFAPEREGQTLPQLLTVPMPASHVAWGKYLAVGAQTGYVFLMGIPLAVMLAMFGFLAWNLAGRFLLMELACGAFAASWGLWCSMRHDAARRALGWALGGVGSLVIFGPLFGGYVLDALSAGVGGDLDFASRAVMVLWPLPALGRALQTPATGTMTFALPPGDWLLTVWFYGGAALVLFALTARAFRRYSQSA